MNNITQLIVVHIIYTILINNFTYMCVYTLKTSGLLIVNKTYDLFGYVWSKFYYSKTYDDKTLYQVI